nr:MAG TPA: hypothetical protein [Bacteriophage sp.]
MKYRIHHLKRPHFGNMVRFFKKDKKTLDYLQVKL